MLTKTANPAKSERQRIDVFAPWIAFPVFYCAYYVLGMLPLTSLPYAGPKVMWLIALGIAAYMLGTLVAHRSTSKEAEAEPGAGADDEGERGEEGAFEWKRVRWFVWILVGLAVIGTLFVLKNGIPLIDAASRQYESPKWTFLANLVIPAYLIWLSFYLRKGTSGLGGTAGPWGTARLGASSKLVPLAMLGLASLVLLALAYRHPLLVMVVASLFIAHYKLGRLSVAQSLGIFGLLAFVATAVGWARILLGESYESVDNALASGVNPLVLLALPFHFVTREGPIVLQEIMKVVPVDGWFHGAMQLAVFKTLLPGSQSTPSYMVAALLGTEPGRSITSGFFGPFYLDFGIIGVAVEMFLVGVIMRRMYDWMRSRGPGRDLRIAIYSLTYASVIISIHVGFFISFNFYAHIGILAMLYWTARVLGSGSLGRVPAPVPVPATGVPVPAQATGAPPPATGVPVGAPFYVSKESAPDEVVEVPGVDVPGPRIEVIQVPESLPETATDGGGPTDQSLGGSESSLGVSEPPLAASSSPEPPSPDPVP